MKNNEIIGKLWKVRKEWCMYIKYTVVLFIYHIINYHFAMGFHTHWIIHLLQEKEYYVRNTSIYFTPSTKKNKKQCGDIEVWWYRNVVIQKCGKMITLVNFNEGSCVVNWVNLVQTTDAIYCYFDIITIWNTKRHITSLW